MRLGRHYRVTIFRSYIKLYLPFDVENTKEFNEAIQPALKYLSAEGWLDGDEITKVYVYRGHRKIGEAKLI
jgi:hypothetical protein